MTKTLPVVALSLGLAVSTQAGNPSRSAVLAHDVAAALAAQRLDAIATQYPNQPDRFVAALYLPGAQLLVVAGRHPSPEALQLRLQNRQFRAVYLDLQGSSDHTGRWFMQDMNADGLCGGRDQAADILYDSSGTPTVFDGDWRKHDLPEKEYSELWSATDQQYARLLEVLLAQLRRT